MYSIKVNNLSHSIDKEEILKDITFNVKKGEFISLLGSNGSGKSTLARIIADIEDEKSESIEFESKPGIVLENPDNQIIGTTVMDDIMFGLQNIDISKEEMFKKLDKTLERFGLTDLKNKSVLELSGGEKQKLAFASLWALEYDIYILDEVTSMLDPKSKEMVLKLIDELSKEGKTIIQITHFLEEANNSERIIILNEGKIVADGKVEEILSNETLLEENRLI